MKCFQAFWKLNVTDFEEKDALIIAMRPGSEFLMPKDQKSAFPHIEYTNFQTLEWPSQGIGILDDHLVVLKSAPDLATAPEGMEWQNLRSLLAVLNADETEAMNRAAVIVNWDATHRYCGVCGTMTILDNVELARVCPSCSYRSYPRISPSMIARITNGNRILLAHNKRFSLNVYSCIAGYTEPGEPVERTVSREIKEETGLDIIGSPQYLTSQSWPFPNSLMMAFAVTAVGEPIPDGVEITDARWFTANDLPRLPRPGAIAHWLINSWLETQ